MPRPSLRLVSSRPPRRGGGRRGAARGLALACAATFLGVLAVGALAPPLAQAGLEAWRGERVLVRRVIDGDTFDLWSGERVRIANIDAAETPPKARCEREARLALAARARLRQMLREGRVELHRAGRDRDRYGRLLRRASVDRRDVGERLVAEGLARPWGGRRGPWC